MTELRTAVPGDTDAVAEIFLRARTAALPYLPSPSSAAELRGFLGGHVASGATTVAVDGERVLGFVVLGVSRVEHLYVDPAVWRRGVGGLLLRHAQQPRRGGVDLWVFQRNAAAIAFY
ncbi:MAG TPA: GNAT family N-acetyltransferase, partial [Solirubrobacteraceae bacterium]|nr:GNAT family N-acetyltransferase [Solirubrobacteraceae bacterium]